MSIKHITTTELRRMNGKEGLILQGCGGEAQEWLDGINGLLTEDGILQNGSRFENILVFTREGLTNILFPFDNSVQLDIGRLAVWRLQTHEHFGGKWLSDYVENELGGFLTEETAEQKNPDRKLIGDEENELVDQNMSMGGI